MHELSFAENVVDIVTRAARDHGGTRVLRVALKVGRLSGLDKASLTFCLEAITPGTLMDGARIDVTDVAPELNCPNCGVVEMGAVHSLACPKCGAQAELSMGTDLYVEEIELDDEQADQS